MPVSIVLQVRGPSDRIVIGLANLTSGIHA
jgi:hypothetical protein